MMMIMVIKYLMVVYHYPRFAFTGPPRGIDRHLASRGGGAAE